MNEYLAPEQKIINKTVEALSAMQKPDYSEFEPRVVATTINILLQDQNWLEKIAGMISARNPKISLTKGNSDDFEFVVKGPGEYVVLSDGEKKINVIISPYSKAVMFQ